MDVLDGFISTWSRARETFGQGVPATGERFNQSGPLTAMQSTVESAAPGARWTGAGATAYQIANADHGKVFGQLAALDRQLSSHVTASSEVVAAGRQNLETIRKWVVDAAAAVPPGKNHDQMVMQIVNKGLGQLREVVTTSNGDLVTIGGKIRGLGGAYEALGNQKFAPKEGPGDALGIIGKDGEEEVPRTPTTPGRPANPADNWVGNPDFGHWETVPASADGTTPPLTPEYRPFTDDTPLKVGPTTGMYVPGKTWISDEDAPAVAFQEEYRFRIAGTEATDVTRLVNVNGENQVQRWVGNVYEYQRNTWTGATGDLSGLPPIQNIDQTWEPISLPEMATLSGMNPTTTYYVPDGCGGSVEFNGGVPDGVVLPQPPTMTRPR
ncbi:hypothetical protein CIW49_22720 [Mycolicibacterium sp. P1-18]|uniref:EspA/EspE family type VII secretion system effector n=1 Tax=Mycolicibacterium sp. P1-18 TaxID=2024615 RepID=UPI0011F0F5BA|nr:EspA/EspE family type VII secretion system effector [Mycolicibacterium sp. P1-18]KAA0095294.1 hypothetical protein CIW49_22720 [Mycolicibacterium sp. P1-18]